MLGQASLVTSATEALKSKQPSDHMSQEKTVLPRHGAAHGMLHTLHRSSLLIFKTCNSIPFVRSISERGREKTCYFHTLGDKATKWSNALGYIVSKSYIKC